MHSETAPTSGEDAPQQTNSPILVDRREKLAQHRRENPVAFPNKGVTPTWLAAAVAKHYGEYTRETLASSPAVKISLAGRMMRKRLQGKASFAALQDSSGQMQIYLNDQSVGPVVHECFKRWDIGDFLYVEGTLFKTMRGELTVHAEKIQLVVKSARPLPDKFHGISDTELCYRQRYLDLIVNPDTRQRFLTRSRIVQLLREHLSKHDFVEVDTPMLHPIPGGAAAKPFVTHHHALSQSMFLRIAPELYLKRLVVGGLERVFEINRNFRNEGMSPRHNPEFTMLEFYAAYTDYQWMMDFTERLIREITLAVTGTKVLPYQGKTIDFDAPFARQTMAQAIVQHARHYEGQLEEVSFLRKEIQRISGTAPPHTLGLGSLLLNLFELVAEPFLWEPTYIVDYPIEVSPLARCSDTQPELTERFELFIAGREIANGFSELNDPDEQAARFAAQVQARKGGDDEAMHFDADYIEALEHGMPPTGGCGIGVDRLVMLLTNSSNIRDVILFPTLRSEHRPADNTGP